MGVCRLTSYVHSHAHLFFKSYDLKDTYVIIDGGNLSHFILRQSEIDTRFGGDYDHYYYVVQEFFRPFLLCNITPIVVMDGAYENKRLETVERRRDEKIQRLRRLKADPDADLQFFSIFDGIVFISAIKDLGIICVRSSFEADDEIAALAQHLKCPVIAEDSDYFIYDVQFIPTRSVNFKNVDTLRCVQCQLYQREEFEKYHGIRRDVMPLIAAVYGNDYCDSRLFKPFLSKIPQNFSHDFLRNVLEWFRGKTFEKARCLILSCFYCRDAAEKQIQINVENYTNLSVTIASVLKNADEQLKFLMHNIRESTQDFSKLDCIMPSIVEKVNQCQLPSYTLDMAIQHSFDGRICLEDIDKESSDLLCLTIIRAIYTFMLRRKKSKSPLLFSVRHGDRSELIRLTTLSELEIGTKPLSGALREKIFNQVLNINEDDHKALSAFPQEWFLFMLAMVYWLKSMKYDLTPSHVHAVLLNLVAHVIQKKLGFFKSVSEFKQEYNESLPVQEQNNNEVSFQDVSISELVNSLEENDCVPLAKFFISLKADKSSRKKIDSVWNLHIFTSLQVILSYIHDFSTLMKSPFKPLKYSELYTGSLIFSLHEILRAKVHQMDYVKDLLGVSPKLNYLYYLIVQALKSYLP